jgi:hypothetical protein
VEALFLGLWGLPQLVGRGVENAFALVNAVAILHLTENFPSVPVEVFADRHPYILERV